MTAMQQELNRQLQAITDQKDQQRAEYIQVIEKQKEDIAALNNLILQQGQTGKESDQRTYFLEEENTNLKS